MTEWLYVIVLDDRKQIEIHSNLRTAAENGFFVFYTEGRRVMLNSAYIVQMDEHKVEHGN